MKKTILMAVLMIFAVSTFAQAGNASHQKTSKTATTGHHHKHKKK
jgi:hypothetical protein